MNDELQFLAALLALRPGETMADRLAEYLRPEPWVADARCRDSGVNTFYEGNTDVALAICSRCPVIEPCRAAGAQERFGVWAGTTEQERRAIRSSGRLPRPVSDDEVA